MNFVNKNQENTLVEDKKEEEEEEEEEEENGVNRIYWVDEKAFQ